MPGGDFFLGSASPRRLELLARFIAKAHLHTVTAALDEEAFLAQNTHLTIGERIEALCAKKADAILAAKALPAAGLLLTADTAVVLEDEILGKPRNAKEAALMLRRLSGRSHTVHTGLCLQSLSDRGKRMTSLETTQVRFGNLSAELIDWYVQSGEPFDKAGGYGIQGHGAALIESIDGCYYNVMGLPVRRLFDLLQDAGEPLNFILESNHLLPWTGPPKEGSKDHARNQENDHEGFAAR